MTVEDAHRYILDLCKKHIPDEFKSCPVGVQLRIADPASEGGVNWNIEAEITMWPGGRRPFITLDCFGAEAKTLGSALLKLCANADVSVPSRIKHWASEDFWSRDPMR